MRKFKFKNAKKLLTLSMAGSMLLASTQTAFATNTITITYTDGVYGVTLFADQSYEGLKAGNTTPQFVGTPTRDGYTFEGWDPEVTPTVDPSMADEEGEIMYVARWSNDEHTQTQAELPMAKIIVSEAKGKKYTAFKLMDLETDGEHYSYTINDTYRNIIVEAINEIAPNANVNDTDASIIKYLNGLKEKPADIRAFADKVYTKILDNELDGELTTETGTFETTTQGYYLIAETGIIAEGTDRTLVMLDTLGQETLTVKEKRGVPKLDKVIVEDGNDTEYTDAGLSDEVTFKITGTMPEEIDAYETYKYIIHDSLPDGLTYQDVESISINGTLLPNPNTFENRECSDANCSIEFKFNDIKATAKELGITINADTKVVVQYTAKVNPNAIVGKPGNQNKAHLEFSNDPYNEGSTENTPDDDAKVFTFSVIVNKLDGDKNPLTGAEFTLQKLDNGVWKDMTPDFNVEYKKSSDGTIFTFETLDVGTYKLIETIVPTGYNKADDVIFEIQPDYENNELHTLYIYDENGNPIGSTNVDDGNAIFSVNVDGGTINTDVINTSGLKLPSTGSTGAIMIYCASGVALIIGAISFIVARKKKNN